MASKFDEYLNKGNFTAKDQEDLSSVKVENLAKDQSSGDVKQKSWTPDPRDAGKQSPEGQKQTVEQAGKDLQAQGVRPEQSTMADRYHAKEPDAQQAGKEQEKDQER